ncbi:MAG TPA: hypothetical protein DC042_06170 [Bacteroidales bacterium]|nr:hypothetical protein [Bacteroidales bacterium]
MRRRLIIGLILGIGFGVSGVSGYAQGDEANVLLNNLAKNFEKLEQFSAEAVIKVDVDFIKIKDRVIKVRFEKPDKFTFDSEGLTLLPKNGLQLEYLTLISKGYTSILAGQEDLSGIHTKIVKVIPEIETEDIVLAQMWIDPVANRIVKMKTYTKKSGSYLIEFKYTDHPFNLPDQTVVTFDISALTLPAKVMSEFQPQAEKVKEGPSTARVIVQYRNYKVNQ